MVSMDFFLEPYRVCDVNDLMMNTLGAWIGCWIAPAFKVFFPNREKQKIKSFKKAKNISVFIQYLIFLGDILLFQLITGTSIFLVKIIEFTLNISISGTTYIIVYTVLSIVTFLVLFVLIPKKGGFQQTSAMKLLKYRMSDGKKWNVYLLRNLIIYLPYCIFAVLEDMFTNLNLKISGSIISFLSWLIIAIHLYFIIQIIFRKKVDWLDKKMNISLERCQL